MDLKNKNLNALAKALSPAYLRIGGSAEDSTVYNISGACLNIKPFKYSCSQIPIPNYACLEVDRWKEIIKFINDNNLKLIFGLNACYERPSRHETMNWDNVIGLFKTTLDKNIIKDDISNIYAFEFGNEISWSIEAKQFAIDFYKLHTTIQDMWKGYDSIPYVMGFDQWQMDEGYYWVNNILNNLTNTVGVKKPFIKAITYHNYPKCYHHVVGKYAFALDCLRENVNTIANKYYKLGKKYTNIIHNGNVIMGEGAEFSGGGRCGVSDSFGGIFYYLYHLCSLIKDGITGTIRSDLVGGCYELIDKKTFIPNPDYWILYLWKQFIGKDMYDVILMDKDKKTSFKRDKMDRQTVIETFVFSYKGNENNKIVILMNYHLKESYRIKLEYKFNNCQQYRLTGQFSDRNIFVNDLKMEYKNGKFSQIIPEFCDGNFVIKPLTVILAKIS